PDVRDGRREVDVAHALAAHLGLDHLDAALLAHHATVPHALVLAAVALVVLGRPEDLGAEQAVTLGLEGAVVDGLRLLHLAFRRASANGRIFAGEASEMRMAFKVRVFFGFSNRLNRSSIIETIPPVRTKTSFLRHSWVTPGGAAPRRARRRAPGSGALSP